MDSSSKKVMKKNCCDFYRYRTRRYRAPHIIWCKSVRRTLHSSPIWHLFSSKALLFSTISYAVSFENMDDLKAKYPTVEVLSIDLCNWKEVKEKFPQMLKGILLDGLVNNAGITICKPFEELTEDDYDK